MIKINRIYTRTGDTGTTSLVRGPRRPKYDLRVEAYGTVDEANASIGAARIHTGSMPKVDMLLGRIQNDLFDVGSDLATPGLDEPDAQYPSLRIRPVQTEFLEKQIDHYNADLAPLTSFVLPAGSPLAAALHVARTVTRRAERIAVELAAAEADTSPETVRYLNRLSDLLFVLARVANGNGARDVLWIPGNHGDLKKGG
ncbi:MAG: cob(I)yrinic acid a,c-diamide adenosyltransferase [Devosia sp.]|jgi:cob(I)alamin adenosyltransferase|uniref:cob(I)yrinic acid a,c-diamide adenosyltransferase n=1 Tax=Devosia sp. XGJD_8 TaxID=3391187 RepID=UPI001D5AE2D8|nr:cob(I)yrinic acid a,c-diamide adenosyltransferase [Alphaproteobacteria bacterium]MBU1561333.1 cob(I)yrinic acid a,c-diamide adenosyltransferase [Alphaproteobacteria bacterium]MBU2303877.1 cob(I)yrinic acid a,c-diamide adenosyltransferase [Alphaproteobacteria bacterium]MBU2366522.1 cob(I)yrinic acid a,c-diamide adenosyltransferase [Alphaproteobacteria bacterium]